MADGKPGIDPRAITVENMAKILTATMGQRIDVAMIVKDLQAGAPVNKDGTLNLVEYAAWLSLDEKERATVGALTPTAP